VIKEKMKCAGYWCTYTKMILKILSIEHYGLKDSIATYHRMQKA